MSTSVYRNTKRKARKARRCYSCPAGVAAGDQYVSHFSVTDGDAFSASFCAPCADLIDSIWDEHDDEYLDYGDLWEAAEALEADPEARPLSLAWHARMGTPVRYVDGARFRLRQGQQGNGLVIPPGVECSRGRDWLELGLPVSDMAPQAECVAVFVALSDDELRALIAAGGET